MGRPWAAVQVINGSKSGGIRRETHGQIHQHENGKAVEASANDLLSRFAERSIAAGVRAVVTQREKSVYGPLPVGLGTVPALLIGRRTPVRPLRFWPHCGFQFFP